MTEFRRRRLPEATADDLNWSPFFASVQEAISYRDGYVLLLAKDRENASGRWYYQVENVRPDAVTGQMSGGRGGRAYLAPDMTEGQLIRIVFGLFKAYEEHECREFFKWNGKSIYGPHISTGALHSVADDLDLGTPL